MDILSVLAFTLIHSLSLSHTFALFVHKLCCTIYGGAVRQIGLTAQTVMSLMQN